MENEKKFDAQELTEENTDEISGGAHITHHNPHTPLSLKNVKTVTITDPKDPIIKKIPKFEFGQQITTVPDIVRYTKKEVDFLEKRGYHPIMYTPYGLGYNARYVANPDEIWCLVTNGFKVDVTY